MADDFDPASALVLTDSQRVALRDMAKVASLFAQSALVRLLGPEKARAIAERPATHVMVEIDVIGGEEGLRVTLRSPPDFQEPTLICELSEAPPGARRQS